MPLSYKKIGEFVRNRVGAPVRERFRLQTMVKDALQKLADKIPLDNNRRALLKTPRATTTATLTAGVADLSTLVNSTPFINLNRIRFGEVYLGSSTVPLEWVPDSSTLVLEEAVDSDFKVYWIEGTKLYTKDATLAGTLSFAVPFVPTLSTLPRDLETALVDEVTMIAKTAQGSGWIEGKEEDEYDKPEAIVE
jgi:hypothetical protein